MISKQITVVVAIVLLAGIAATFVYMRQPAPQKIVNVVTTIPSPTPTPATLLTWTDEAGFSFQYPEGTTIDKHPEDTKNYANLTLTLPSGKVINVKMSDNTYKDLSAWAGQNSAIDAFLGGQNAKKIIDENGQEIIACIDNDVLVTISGSSLSTISNSWVFIYPTASATKSTATDNSGGEDVLEEE